MSEEAEMTDRDEDQLEAFFAAARAETVPPRSTLYGAILADAAAASAGRAALAAIPPRRRLPWAAASALAACAALGFWVGLVGTGDYGTASLRSAAAFSDDGPDPVDAFFDLASVEG